MPGPTRGATSGLARRDFLRLSGTVGAVGALTACTSSGPSPVAGSSAEPTGLLTFPEGFRWGSATSAFQVEGSTTADGRGASIWDTFAARTGAIKDGGTGDPGADHYRRWESDLDLMVTLGIPAYRFSVAWPRIQPTGSGAVNQPGLDFYKRLVDGLLERGIHPAATLYHWDLPQPLQDAGGWESRETALRFADYATVVFEALGGQGADWFTINEPKTTAFNGYYYGAHAPGVRSPEAAVRAVHHQLLGHGLAVQAFRAAVPASAEDGIGIALNLAPVYPALGGEDAAVRADGLENRLYLDPVLLGRYPEDALGELAGQLHVDPAALTGVVQDGDLTTISAPCDFLAVQYYGAMAVDKAGQSVQMFDTSEAFWQQVHPEGLYDTLVRLRDDYPAIPLYITENGIPDRGPDGTTVDTERQDYLRTHLQQAARAIEDGVDLRAYYAWSFLDNFEWAEGYAQRWGLVHVDFATQERTPKDSVTWYGAVIRQNAVAADG